jgi:hypothetical protein
VCMQKLKETNKQLATMTADHNQLMIRTREIETQLALAQPSRMVCPAPQTSKNPQAKFIYVPFPAS